MDAKKQSNARKLLTIVIVAIAGGLITKLPYLRETYMEPLQQATGATKTQLGMIMSAYGIVNFICYFPGGVLADKFSSKKLIVISCIGTALTGFWYWTMPGFIGLVVIHAIFAVTTVFTFWAAMVKSVNRLGGPEEQGRLFGGLEGGRGLIGTVAAFGSVAVFGMAADDIGGMKNAILYYSILLVIAGILAAIFMENDTPAKVEKKEKNPLNMKDFMTVAKMPRVWLCGALGVCNYSALIFHGYVTAYLSEAFGLSATVVANLSVIRTYFMMMVGAFIAGLISDKIGSRIKFIKYAFIGMVVFATAYIAIPTGKGAVPIIVANFVCFGMCLYSIKALYFSTIDEVLVPKKLAGTASGIISLVTYAPEVFLYTVSGKMVDKYIGTATPLQGYINCFIAMAILSAIGFVCGFILIRLNRKAIAKAQAAGTLEA
ncbi:sugar phosphate permease [Lachnospiraceae bacterium PF1-21]|uniref:MFS transporter n=1 Tax=Ohessyouella blattaphilus TaxID=2949333 RepID=A0ABT1EH06_9FIRM|nr:MFS transporter [Ohessyouella blattaphilus]MCP1109990.1 MFS transporter [Ohessyouella blattaphilus]MCR8563384.1 MFS transporter [Ohessyouella blattaphilus]MDL2250901.1 MFS transporter [Lachnospiraceae bacterium OttesenSCG-928-J05]